MYKKRLNEKRRVCPTGFGATFVTVFVLICRLRESPLSAVTNRFELKCQLKQLLLLYYKICARWRGSNK